MRMTGSWLRSAGGEQALGIGRVGRNRHHQAGAVGPDGVVGAAVVGAGALDHSHGGPNQERHAELAIAHVAQLGRLLNDLGSRLEHEVAEHEVADGAAAPGRRPEGRPGKAQLADGGIDHAIAAELLPHPLGVGEAAAAPADALAEVDEVGAAPHLGGDSVPGSLQPSLFTGFRSRRLPLGHLDHGTPDGIVDGGLRRQRRTQRELFGLVDPRLDPGFQGVQLVSASHCRSGSVFGPAVESGTSASTGRSPPGSDKCPPGVRPHDDPPCDRCGPRSGWGPVPFPGPFAAAFSMTRWTASTSLPSTLSPGMP